MFMRLAALFIVGTTMAGGAFGQALVCTIENNFTGVFEGFPGDYTVTAAPNANATLRANCTADVNSYNWNPGNLQTSQIPVTAPAAPGNTALYTLQGCNSGTMLCGATVTITIQAASTAAPACTLTGAPNPAVSGQTVTFTAVCDSGLPPPAQISYTDLSGTSRQSTALTFTDTAPAVAAQTVRDVFYQPIGTGGARGVERVLLITINPNAGLQPPANCTLSANPNPVVLGLSTLLTAACSAGGAPTSYTFLDGNLNVLSTASSNTLTVTPPNAGNNTYFVRASNAAGQAPAAAVEVIVTQPPPSGCTVTAAPNPIALGTSTVLTGQCTGGGAATNYAFTSPDGGVSNGPRAHRP